MNGFAIVEQMGHRKFGARIEEADVAGVRMLRCTILRADAEIVTVVHPQSLFALTPSTEDQARKANAGWGSYAPPEVRELPASAAEPVPEAEHTYLPANPDDDGPDEAEDRDIPF